MNLRVSRVMTAHLKDVKAQTEQILGEADLKKIILEALNNNYDPFFENRIRQDDIKILVKKLYLLVSQFSVSGVPENMLDLELQPYRNKFLNIISEIAKSQKNSILDTVYDYFKKNPTSNAEEVEVYVQNFLRKIVIDVDRYIVKWKDMQNI